MSVQIAVDNLTSGVPGEDILIGPDKIAYGQVFDLTDFSLDECINLRAAEQLFNFGLPLSIPSGSAYPLVVDMTAPTYANIKPGFIAQFEVLNDVFANATSSFPIWDCKCVKNYTDNSRTALSSLTIFAHEDPATPGITIDELQLIMR